MEFNTFHQHFCHRTLSNLDALVWRLKPRKGARLQQPSHPIQALNTRRVVLLSFNSVPLSLPLYVSTLFFPFSFQLFLFLLLQWCVLSDNKLLLPLAAKHRYPVDRGWQDPVRNFFSRNSGRESRISKNTTCRLRCRHSRNKLRYHVI